METWSRRRFVTTTALTAAAASVGPVLLHAADRAARTGGDPRENPEGLKAAFANPPREFGFMPLWFWNDDLTDTGILGQIGEFYAKGFGGFVIHPRVGLSRRVGYLTPEFFRLVRLAVGEAARLGLKVILYDEAGYPAGSARGRVVAENPEWAARCLFALHHHVTGPGRGFWRPSPGRPLGYRLVSVVAGREIAKDTLDPESLRTLTWDEHELVHWDFPEGNWRIVAAWEGHSGGTTRGAFEEEEDGHALAPPAADILREDAVAFFMRVTHDEYYAHLREFFGSTVVAMFTDEPTPMGRIFDPVLRVTRFAWTPGFLQHLQPWWNDDVKRWLPALWLDCGPRTADFRWAYRKAVQQRLEKSYYEPISAWCSAHGIALTGHPANSNELGILRRFQWPGQDLVWRMVVPGSASAVSGPDSLTAKAASSAARLGRRRFNSVEVFGGYGWTLTFDEIKWLLDWHFVRGTNHIYAHAAFYSIRGRRAFESEPDLAVNNVWWPHFGLLGDYGRRMCWLISDGEHVCETGIVSDGDALAWKASSVLLQCQQDFIFVDDPALASAKVEGGRLTAGTQRLKLLIVDQPGILTAAAEERLAQFAAAGGKVLREWSPENLGREVAAALGRDVEWRGNGGASLRTMHYRKGGRDFFLLVNEGEATLEGQASLGVAGRVERWNALDGSTAGWPGEITGGNRVQVPLRLERRETAWFAVDAARQPEPRAALPDIAGNAAAEAGGPWTATDPAGKSVPVPVLGDWARADGWETFSGTLSYRAKIDLPSGGALPRFIDLGRVGDIAEVWVNERRIGVRAWAPYVLDLGGACRAGTNQLEVRVTNSMANSCDGRQLPSGLMGPVSLRFAHSGASS
ncbi:MAG: hypothetical protein JWM88_74 [Verrucomicrobia bacterium]|nr:hypothetical protein [Verrucomicrobiota bacterium]